MKRLGMCKGSGKRGYYNMMPRDSYIHALSAKGMKSKLPYVKQTILPRPSGLFMQCFKIPYKNRFNNNFIKRIHKAKELESVGKMKLFFKDAFFKELFKEVLDYDVIIVNRGTSEFTTRGAIGRFTDDFDRTTNAIFIRNDLSDEQTIRTLLHEATHGIQKDKTKIVIESQKDYTKYCKMETEQVADRYALLLGEK